MELGIFISPIIALILVVVMYFSLLKKTTDKKKLNRLFLIIMVIAFMLNYAWELIQCPLYIGCTNENYHVLFCGLASVADVLMVLLLYSSFGLIYNKPFWIENMKIKQITYLVLIGGIGAIIAEMKYISGGYWSYNDSMPIIPLINVGISPLLQFLLLPIIIFYISLYFSERYMKKHK